MCQGNGFFIQGECTRKGSRFQRFSGFFRCRQRFLVAEATQQRTLTQIRERLERENGYTTMCVYQLAMISWLLLQRRLLQPPRSNKPKSRAVQHTCEGNNCQGHGNIISPFQVSVCEFILKETPEKCRLVELTTSKRHTYAKEGFFDI